MAKTLDYDFTDPQFDGTTGIEAQTGPTLTVTRADNATVMDYFNVLKTVGNNEPRFTGGRRVENLCLQSQTFNTGWVQSNLSVSADVATLAPDGSATADEIIEDGTSNFHRVSYNTTVPNNNNSHTFSCYAKAGSGSRYFQLGVTTDSGSFGVINVDLTDGSYTLSSQTGCTVTNIIVADVGDGWYRASIKWSDPVATDYRILTLGLSDQATYGGGNRGSESYQGDGTSSIFLWGAQLENVTGQDDPAPSEYIATTTAAKAQWYDTKQDGSALDTPITGLLIEEARTNVFKWTESFDNAAWGKTALTCAGADINAATAPDGTLTADRLNVDVSTSVHRTWQHFTAYNATDVVFSCFFKADGNTYPHLDVYGGFSTNYICATYDLTAGTVSQTAVGSTSGTIAGTGIDDVGNGWFRCWIAGKITDVDQYPTIYFADSATPTVGSSGQVTYLGVAGEDLLVWGADFQAGSFPTSYIPNDSATASVTRAADVVKTTDLSWYDNTAGTFYTDTPSDGSAGRPANSFIFSLNHDGWNETIEVFRSPGNDACATVKVNVGTDFGAQLGTANEFDGTTNVKTALGIAVNDLALYADGVLVKTDTSGDMPTTPTLKTLDIGSAYDDTSYIYTGHIARIVYYDERLADSVLEDLSNGTFPATSFPGTLAGDGGPVWPPRSNDPRWAQIITDSGITASGNFIDDVHAALEALGATTGQLDTLWKKVKAANSVTDTSEPYLY